MNKTCWQCEARLRPSSMYCKECGAEIGARIAVDNVAKRKPPRALPGLVLVAVLAVAALLLASADTPVTEESAVPDGSAEDLGLSAAEDDPYETLGRTTGVTAVVLTAAGLEFIDLDTARRQKVPLADPVASDTLAVGNRLLLLGDTILVPTGPSVWSIQLAAGRATDIGPGDRVAPSLDPGRAWVWTAQTAEWRQIDPSGATVQQLEWPEAAIPWDHGAGTPELASAAGGGIYRYGEGWSLISAGVPLAGNTSTALVQECSTLTSCSYRWVELETGNEIDGSLPPRISPAERRYRLSPSGENLLEMSPTNRSWEAVFNYRDGLVRSTACMQGWEGAAWSADESLLACVTNRGVAVSDIDNGPAALFDRWDSPPIAVILVDTELIGLGR